MHQSQPKRGLLQVAHERGLRTPLQTAATLLLVVGGGLVMVLTFAGSQLGVFAGKKDAPTRQTTPAIAVETRRPKRESIEVTATYAGMLRPFERYTMQFEQGGQLEGLSGGPGKQNLDEGDYVIEGEVIARLDNTILAANRDEAAARLEESQTNLQRARKVLATNPNAISDAEIEKLVTQERIFRASLRVADERLEKSVLVAPANAVISKRFVNPGVTIAAHTPVLELLEISRLLLVVGVPEARVHEIRIGQPVHVQLVGRDLYGRMLPPVDGEVYRVGQAADQQTGLFEVEVSLPNLDRRLLPTAAAVVFAAWAGHSHPGALPVASAWPLLETVRDPQRLRPGLIARAHIVVDRLQGYRFPSEALVTRDDQEGLFAVDANHQARFVALSEKIEQGGSLIVPNLPPGCSRIVVRGQHRLIDGAAVKVVERNRPSDRLPAAPRVRVSAPQAAAP